MIKSFTLDDQRRFAELSGDFNPLHLDPVYCRRLLFGAPVVHGLHLLLWCLDQWLASRAGPVALTDLKGLFRNPLMLDEPVALQSMEASDDAFTILASGEHCRVEGRFRAATLEESDGPREEDGPVFAARELGQPSPCPKSLCFAEAARAQGSLPLRLDRSALASMFPAVAVGLPALQVAQVLATTRLAGMECPGLHSLYHAFELRFDASDQSPDLHYQVSRSDERFSVIELAVRSAGMEGKVATFFRPPPVAQPSLAEVAAAVQPGEFRGQRALVVGGSRGLGELTAKIVAAGGGAVCITYHRGKDDAERIVRELSEAGVECRLMPCDVRVELPAAVREELAAWRLTHIYYFATPHIGSSPLRRGPAWDWERFEQFCRFYLGGLAKVLAAVEPPADGTLRVFYPSSVYVETAGEGLAEYAAAKAAGEALCRYLQQQSRKLRIYAPRLPRLPTDQTAGIGPQRMAGALDTMLRGIRKMREGLGIGD